MGYLVLIRSLNSKMVMSNSFIDKISVRSQTSQIGSISAAHSSSGMSAGSFPETAAGNRALRHFRVHVCLLFKASLIAKFFSRILVFIHM